ncbi:MAG: phosphate acyltransferase PlsX [Alphaproteobacteria bacterium]|nr:phosphate acyltransferase PlsX [Alphaproteobacteria bacterium]MBF0356887.1 phosphate acyltransferase PlsX [Alphaproteobacteria bacterium]
MTDEVVLALDAMGGDAAPQMVIDGIAIAKTRFPKVRYLLVGDEPRLKEMLASRQDVAEVCTIRHAPDSVSADAKPSQVLRTGRKSSMWMAVDAVAKGEAGGVVSAGNTGALMAVSKFVLRTVPGIDRPAIAGLFPSQRGETVMLDLGGNVDCNANNLVEFAIMGEVFCRIVLGIERPSVGILNVGSEDAKGNSAVKTAHSILKSHHMQLSFQGFVEGNDIGAGTVDVIVTDGFTGNVALKTIEGTAKMFSRFLKEAFTHSFLSKIGYLMARPAMHRLKLRADPRRYNGAMFLGLNGITVKSHGGTDALGFANAIGCAVDLVSQDFNAKIKEELAHLAEPEQPAQVASL